MWIEEMGIDISAGLGWMPAIDNFLQIARMIEIHNDFPGSVHSVRNYKGNLQIDANLPTDEAEHAMLQATLNDWVHQICEVCGQKGEFIGEKTRCSKHSTCEASVLSSVKAVFEPGIPTFKKGAVVICKAASEQFLIIEYGYPKVFMPPEDRGTIIDQTTTPYHEFLSRDEGRVKVLETKYRDDVHMLFLDINSYNELYYQKPGKGNMSLMNAIKSGDKDLLLKVIEDECKLPSSKPKKSGKRKRLDRSKLENVTPEEKHYITGLSAMSIPDHEKGFGILEKPKNTEISGIHLESTWHLLDSEGVYKATQGIKEFRVILPSPLVASHERAFFDLLHGHIKKPGDSLPFDPNCIHLINIFLVQIWIEEVIELEDTKNLYRKVIGKLIENSEIKFI